MPCPHGRQRSRCKECGGSGICEHRWSRYQCKECGGNGICEHGLRFENCEDCREAISWLGVMESAGGDNVPVTRPPGGKAVNASFCHSIINSSSMLIRPYPNRIEEITCCALILLTPPDLPTRRVARRKKWGSSTPVRLIRRAQRDAIFWGRTPTDPGDLRSCRPASSG